MSHPLHQKPKSCEHEESRTNRADKTRTDNKNQTPPLGKSTLTINPVRHCSHHVFDLHVTTRSMGASRFALCDPLYGCEVSVFACPESRVIL